MKTIVHVAAVALLSGAPLVASASETRARSDHPLATGQETKSRGENSIPAERRSVSPQFIGPFRLHNGLLPNGLLPNAFTYG